MDNKLVFIGCETPFDKATHVLFGAPFDGTTSFRPGTRFASKAMRNDSFLGYESYSPNLDQDLYDYLIHDAGDLELPIGDVKETVKSIHDYAQSLTHKNKIPVMIGGEHLVTLGVVEVLAHKYPDLHIIHFDAHTDLREEYLGNPLNHATVLKRCYDILGDGRIHQFGIRSGLKEEFEFAKKHTSLQKFNMDGLKDTVKFLAGKPVYVTIDLDVLDPSVFPGTGTPEPGGIDFHTLMDSIYKLKKLNIVGADVVELAPTLDATGVSTAVAIKTLRELLLVMNDKGEKNG